MMLQKSIRDVVDHSALEHRMFREQLGGLCRVIDDTLANRPPSIEWLIGPSRVGKSHLVEALARMYPQTRINGARLLPVLVVPLPSPVSPLLLPISVLEALDVPPGASPKKYFKRMSDQLRLAKTRVLLIEEASHAVEPGARVIPRAAGDWFKQVHDQLGMTIIMFGLPRLERLFASNEQLRGRALARRELRPYCCSVELDFREFASYVRTYLEFFRQKGWTCDVPLDAVVKNCYLISGGLVGVVSKMMRQLAIRISRDAIRPLTFDDFAMAAEAIEHFAHPACMPFSKLLVEPVELNQAHRYVLDISGMSFKPMVPAKSDRSVP